MRGIAAWVALAIATLALPFVLRSPYYVLLLDMILISTIATLGLQLIYSYAGQLSIAHAAFYGIGAYTTALLTVKLGWPVWLGLVAAALVSGCFTVLMSPLVRLRGHYFAMATFAFVQMAHIVFLNWTSLTGGGDGINKIPAPALFGLRLGGYFGMYPVVAVTTVAALLFVARLHQSRFGRALAAIRENEIAAEGVGINPVTIKMQVIFLGGALAGLSGALFAHLIGYINPNNFTFETSVLFLTMVVVGGRSPAGAVVGALLITLVPEYLRALPGYSKYPTLRMIVYGLLIVLITGFVRDGVGGWLQEHINRWRRHPLMPAWARTLRG